MKVEKVEKSGSKNNGRYGYLMTSSQSAKNEKNLKAYITLKSCLS